MNRREGVSDIKWWLEVDRDAMKEASPKQTQKPAKPQLKYQPGRPASTIKRLRTAQRDEGHQKAHQRTVNDHQPPKNEQVRLIQEATAPVEALDRASHPHWGKIG
jgi:hypothetical protein